MLVERNTPLAVQTMVDELGSPKASVRLNAATRLFDRALKARESITVDQELESLRAVIEELRALIAAKQAPPAPIMPDPSRYRMTEQEQSEAIVPRMTWMRELGNSTEEIESSIKFNRPQSVTGEKHLLAAVRKQLQAEKLCTGG